MNKLSFKKSDLYNGCLIGAIAHAIVVGKYPELAYEQSWDGISYNLVGDNGVRGTVTFDGDICVAAFRNEKYVNNNRAENVMKFFEEAPENIKSIAEKEKPLRDSNVISIRYAQHKAYANALKGRIDELTHFLHTL